jgi:Domain of unknown function (DUF4253)
VAIGRLPDEGPVQLGPVTLPAGKLITGYLGTGHVAWVTADPVPGPGRIWAALAGLHPRTGLIPVQVYGRPGNVRGSLNLFETEDPREADRLDASTVLEDMWSDWLPLPDEDDPEWVQVRAPFTREFPGLAPPEHTPLTPAERQHALDVTLPSMHWQAPGARIGLVAAGRPADLLPVIGWGGLANNGKSLLPLTAILRSWEDRFGARLIDIGDADLRVFVERPPRTLRAAQRIAAEQAVLADECAGGARDIPGIAERLVDAPIWTFWWD